MAVEMLLSDDDSAVEKSSPSKQLSALKPDRRLHRSAEIRKVQQSGRSYAGSLVAIRSLPSSHPVTRFSFVTSKRVGNAVVRNRVRRRLREIYRQTPIRPGFDVVVSARAAAATASFWALREAVLSQLGRAKLLGGEPATIPCASLVAH